MDGVVVIAAVLRLRLQRFDSSKPFIEHHAALRDSRQDWQCAVTWRLCQCLDGGETDRGVIALRARKQRVDVRRSGFFRNATGSGATETG